MQTAHLNNSMKTFMSIVWSSVPFVHRNTMKHTMEDECEKKRTSSETSNLLVSIDCGLGSVRVWISVSGCCVTCLFVQLSVETISKHCFGAYTPIPTDSNWTFWLIFPSALYFIVISLFSYVIYFLHCYT